jgi:hypothetical protein
LIPSREAGALPNEHHEQSDHGKPEWQIHSFIIKIWQDLSASGAGKGWRGHITHVPGAERRYLKSLDEISAFIVPYLSEMGVPLKWSWRIRHWLHTPRSKPAANLEDREK